MDILKYLQDATLEQFKWLFAKHFNWSAQNDRIAGAPKFPDGPNQLIAFGIRCNDERDSNNGKWNDYLVVILTQADGSFIKNIIPVTVDPGRDKYGVAHLQQGVWNSYKIRPHNFAKRTFPRVGYISRWAICNDLDVVGITRTDGKGNVIKRERVQAKTNIHDRIGIDPSLGCTVIEDDDDYVDLYLPLLYDLQEAHPVPDNWDNLTYCLVNLDTLEIYINEEVQKVEKAQSTRGSMQVINPGAMGASHSVELPAELDTNEEGLQFIREAEGLRLKAYKDTGGVWTIGYGDTMINGKPVKQGMIITKEEAESNLRADVDIYEDTVKKSIRLDIVSLNQNQFSALVSLCYNIGQGAFAQSTLVKVLNNGDYNGAADQILRWNKDNGKVVDGLTNRRKKERELFLKAA